MMFIKAMLLEGPFLALLPRGIVHHEVESGRLAAIPVAAVQEGIIYRAASVHPPALFVLIDAIRAAQRDAGAGVGAGANTTGAVGSGPIANAFSQAIRTAQQKAATAGNRERTPA